VIFAHENLISNWLTYLVHAKSTDELISFGFCDHSVRRLVSANCSAIRRVQTNDNFTFWLMFGLSPNLGLSESLSERLTKKWINPVPGTANLAPRVHRPSQTGWLVTKLHKTIIFAFFDPLIWIWIYVSQGTSGYCTSSRFLCSRNKLRMCL